MTYKEFFDDQDIPEWPKEECLYWLVYGKKSLPFLKKRDLIAIIKWVVAANYDFKTELE